MIEGQLGLLSRIHNTNARINAFISIAKEIPKPANTTSGRLTGLTVAVKDNIHVAGFPSTCASPMLQTFKPSWDAACVATLKGEGSLIIGKTNMDEFGMGSHSTHTPYGPVRNPLNIHLSAGGSSGGSAAAISSNLVDLALGSDTGGSIRLPASYCGVVGFKPTYGRISRDGLVSYASSLDTIGFVCSDLTVGGIAFEVLKGTGGLKDMTSFQRTLPIKTLDKGDSKGRHGLCGLVVGVAEQMMPSILQKEAKDNLRLALDRLVNLGAEIRTISIPILNFALATYYIHAMIESASCLSRYPLDGMRNADFGEHVKQRISLGRYLASHRNYNRFFGKATSIRDQICFELNQALDTVDILISPTSIGAAPNLTSITNSDESEMFTPQRWEGILQSNFDNSHLEPLQADLLTVPASLARLPAISLPIHSDEVCGIQLIGGHSRDEELLEISKMLMDH